jgi:predicted HTH transcriptional regulator
MEAAPMSANEWALAIEKALKTKIDEVPKEWKTSKQLMSMFKLSKDTMCRKIKMLKDNGLVHEKTFRIKTNHGIQPIPHYKLK